MSFGHGLFENVLLQYRATSIVGASVPLRGVCACDPGRRVVIVLPSMFARQNMQFPDPSGIVAGMQASNVLQNGNMLHMDLTIQPRIGELSSQEYTLCGVVLFRAKSRNTQSNPQHSILFKFTKLFESDHLIYTIKFSSEKLNKVDTFLCADGSNSWEIYASSFKAEIDIDLSLDVLSTCSGLFASLHEDSKLADFELCGDDGSVFVHKSILAGYSPFIKTMLENSDKWSEVTSSSPINTTRETLQHLKDYMYLQKMPDHGVKELAMLASYYIMTDLEQRCAVKLISSLTAENVKELLEFALKYKIRMLFLAIFDYVKRGNIKIPDIDKAFFN